MRPALQPGDRLLVVRRRARPGEVVAVRDPRQHDRVMVKRLTSGDRRTVIVHGDRQDASTDSRHFGAVPRRLVVGVAVYRYAPEERKGPVAPAQ